MASVAEREHYGEIERIADILGGSKVLGRSMTGPFEAHDLLVRGLPGRSLTHLVASLQVLDKSELLEDALGISLRTFQRRKDAGAKPLSPEQSGRMWKFAEILASATRIFGSQRAAEEWLDRPAIGLDQRRPIDLLATPAGVDAVETLLTRIEYGVYA